MATEPEFSFRFLTLKAIIATQGKKEGCYKYQSRRMFIPTNSNSDPTSIGASVGEKHGVCDTMSWLLLST